MLTEQVPSPTHLSNHHLNVSSSLRLSGTTLSSGCLGFSNLANGPRLSICRGESGETWGGGGGAVAYEAILTILYFPDVAGQLCQDS